MMDYPGLGDFQRWAELLKVRPREDFLSTHPESDSSFGIPIITSPYVPKFERFEADYSRPLIVRLVHGRTVDIRTWEEDQIFFVGGAHMRTMALEACGVIRNVTP